MPLGEVKQGSEGPARIATRGVEAVGDELADVDRGERPEIDRSRWP